MSFRVSRWQLFTLVVLTSFCVTPFGTSGLYHILGRHVWVASVAQSVVSAIGLSGVVLLLRRFPGLTLPAIAERVLGKMAGRLYLFALASYLFFWGPIGNQLVLVRMIQSTVMPLTTPMLIAGLMLGVSLYAAYFGPEVVGRTAEIWSFPLLVIIAVLSVVPLLSGDAGRLLPLAGIPGEFALSGDFWSFAIGLRGFILALALGGMMASPARVLLPVAAGEGVASLFVSLMMLAPITVFGPTAAQRFQFPVLDTMDTIDTAAFGINSMMVLTLIAWYVVAWVVCASSLFAAAYLFSKAAGLGSHRQWLIPLAVVGWLLLSFPHTAERQRDFLFAWSALGYVVGVVVPWVLWALACLRRLRGSAPGGVEEGLAS